jgi:fatty-acyl-CoA synthase
MESVMQDMHMSDVTIAYGMTETSPVSFQTGVGDPVDKRVATVGRVHPHVQVKLIDEEGRVVEKGQRGELCTRGYSVMLGYWGDDELTAESIDRAGWMHTGDLAVMDSDGYCDIVGRVKDMIIRGGENVYPREIEEYLLRHPGVQDASVFGVPDAKFGEQVAVWIMVNDGMEVTEDSIREFCKGQIAHFKIPHYVRIVDEFPMTVTGKIQKFVMRDKMNEELGLDQGDSPA